MPEQTRLSRQRPTLVKDAERYKTVICEKWRATGDCPYTFKCQFAHGEAELRRRGRQCETSASAQLGPSSQCDSDVRGRAKTTDSRTRRQLGSDKMLSVAEHAGDKVLDAATCTECTDSVDCSAISGNAPLVVRPVAPLPLLFNLPVLKMEPPAAGLPPGLGSYTRLPLGLNHATGKVEAGGRAGIARQGSHSTMLVRRQMSSLLDELSREASAIEAV